MVIASVSVKQDATTKAFFPGSQYFPPSNSTIIGTPFSREAIRDNILSE